MAVTQLSLLFIGALATLTTIGMFVGFKDRWTKPLVMFLSAILWGIFGMSSFDVITRPEVAGSEAESIMPLAAIGLGLAFIITVFMLYLLVQAIGDEAGLSESEDLTDLLK